MNEELPTYSISHQGGGGDSDTLADSTQSVIERCEGLLESYPNIPMKDVRELLEKVKEYGAFKFLS